MLRKKFNVLLFCLAALLLASAAAAPAQQTPAKLAPDLSAGGVRLGDRASAKAFLGEFQPRIGEDGRPAYYFYNKGATQVLKLTGASFEDRFFITEIEVYRVGRSYTAGHFQAEKIGFFKTEKDIFVGYRQSTASALIGIPNVDGKDEVGPKTVVKKIGEPTSRAKDGDRETLFYELAGLELADETAGGKALRFDYSARYEFNDGRMKRFVLKIAPAK